MRVTKKSGYGLIAMAELADSYNSRFTSTTEIANKYDLPQPFLEKIMRELKNAGLVGVKRGRNGGYELEKPPEEISIKDVVFILEDDSLAPVSCLSPSRNGDCHLESDCPTLMIWSTIQEEFSKVLSSFTLSDLARSVRR